MRGYLYERLDRVSPALMRYHDQYRNRLDMYAVMTILAAVLAVFDAAMLPRVLPVGGTVASVIAFFALSYISYRGAVSTAMDYGPILLAMDSATDTDPTDVAGQLSPG